ncbi:MAG: LacI family transcriptional regulator [Bifidobacteriaceae bacterium]|jgi:LacI family transcriptional regulator|nr:LacI family transcriptional regulator [Bifidobacteriaceae bacterium]
MAEFPERSAAGPARPARRATIKDVAAEAGVSVAAVSKVVRSAYGVSPEMKSRVQAAIDKLGYRPDVGARAMRGHSYTIGVVAPELSSFFVTEVIDAIVSQFEGTAYGVTVMLAGADADRQRRAVHGLIDRKVDGLVLVAPWTPFRWIEKVARSVPTVAVARHGASQDCDTVVSDDEQGARLAVDHLVGLGHRRIAHIGQAAGPDDSHPLSHVVRQRGYEAAMRAHGLEPDVIVGAYSDRGGYDAARTALARAETPTAIFAGADVAALGALRAIEDAGARVPGDISLVGYDNIWLAGVKRIWLTTVDESSQLTGEAAARLLRERLDEGRTRAARHTLAPSLIVRGTTAPPPQGSRLPAD